MNFDKETEEENTHISHQVSRSKKRTKSHKTTEFSYLLERKALRIMRRYYKENFDSRFSYKQRIKDLSPEELDALVK